MRVMESDNNILDLTVQIACQDKELPSDQELGSWVRAALDGSATLTIRFVDSEEGAALNDQFRQKNSPTNVLTFPYAYEPCYEADLVLCPEVVRREAVEQRKSLNAHYAHLLIHGTLHAMGYDHQTEEEASAMEALEIDIMASFGFDDPYQDIFD